MSPVKLVDHQAIADGRDDRAADATERARLCLSRIGLLYGSGEVNGQTVHGPVELYRQRVAVGEQPCEWVRAWAGCYVRRQSFEGGEGVES